MPLPGSSAIGKLLVALEGAEVKLEVNPVHRESLYAPVRRGTQPAALGMFPDMSLQLLSFAETCAGKFNAALTRQHVRDLFDTRIILDAEAITPEVRTAFVVNLLTQAKPFAHMLCPYHRPVQDVEWEHLQDMSWQIVEVSALERALVELERTMSLQMPKHHQDLLLSFTHGTPDWSLLEVGGVAEMPAIRWRLQQMSRLTDDRRMELADMLHAIWPESCTRYSVP